MSQSHVAWRNFSHPPQKSERPPFWIVEGTGYPGMAPTSPSMTLSPTEFHKNLQTGLKLLKSNILIPENRSFTLNRNRENARSKRTGSYVLCAKFRDLIAFHFMQLSLSLFTFYKY
jgi:hypothetical protein